MIIIRILKDRMKFIGSLLFSVNFDHPLNKSKIDFCGAQKLNVYSIIFVTVHVKNDKIEEKSSIDNC